jgi:hypothetical protein
MAKMTPEELAEALSKLTSDQLDKAGLQKKIEAKIDIDKASIADLKALNDEKLRQAQIEIDLANAVQDGTQRIIAEKKARAAQIETLMQYLKKQELMGAYTEENKEQFEALEEQITSLTTALGAQGKEVEDLQKDLDELNKSTKESEKTANKYERSIDSLGRKMVIFGKGPLVKNILGIRELGTELANSEEAQQNFRQAIVDTFNVTNVAGNLLSTVAESTFTLVMALDAASAAFAAATGFGDQFNQTMRDAQQQGNFLGVTMEGAGKATQGLAAGFTNFVNISSDSKAALVSNVAQLERIGVSADTSAGLINFFNQNLGMTAEEGVRVTKELAMMGRELGMTSGQITKDFQAALPTLAVYGDRSVEVFKGLAGAAKVAGVEMNKLLGLAGKFDTFASAADTTGKLNAILGTQMSAVDLLRQSEEQRIETLIANMQAQGRSFKDMDRFTQKAIAAAAGIDNLAEAQRIFGMDLGQYRNYQQEMDKSAEVQKKFEEAVQATIPIQEKFKLLFAEFAVGVVPILEGIHGILDGVLNFFGSLDKEMQENLTQIAVGVLSLFMAFKAFAAVKTIFATLFGPIKLMGSLLGLTAGKTAAAATEMSAAAPAISSTMAQISNAIATSMANISRGVIQAAPAIAILTGALIGIGLAAIALGYGLSQLQGGMLMEFLGFIAGLTVIVAGLAVAFAATGGVGALAFGGAIGLLAGGIAALGAAMLTIPADRMASIASALEAISNISMENVAALGEVFSTMAVGMLELSAAVNALDGKKVKVSSVLENLALLSTGTAKDSMTGAKITAASVNVVSNLENVFNLDGLKAEISIGGQEFKEAVLKVTQE